MLRKPAHFIFYLSTLQKPPASAGFCNVLKYKDDTFYLSTIQKPAPGHTNNKWHASSLDAPHFPQECDGTMLYKLDSFEL